MSRELSKVIRGIIIGLRNEGMLQRKIADNVSQKVLWSEHCRGLRKQDSFPQDQDLADQELPHSERIDTSRKHL